MKIEKNEDQTIFVLAEKDVKEALIQYIENWENTTVLECREYNFVGEELHLVASSISSKSSLAKTSQKILKKVHRRFKNKIKRNRGYR